MRVFRSLAYAFGSITANILALISVLIWAATGPLFDYSDTWQLVINTSTTVITFLMVFIIQNTQNHDTKAMQAKLDELIAATEGARNRLIALEYGSEKEIDTERRDPSRPDN